MRKRDTCELNSTNGRSPEKDNIGGTLKRKGVGCRRRWELSVAMANDVG